jgi:hypothetical protein
MENSQNTNGNYNQQNYNQNYNQNIANQQNLGNNNVGGLGLDEFSEFVNEANQQISSDRKKVDLKALTFNPKAGKIPENFEFRIVPPLVGKAFQKLDIHWGVGSSKMIVCPSQFGRPCSVCSHLSTLDPESDTVKKQKAKTRFFLPIVIRGQEELGVKWWGMSRASLNDIHGLTKNKYYGDLADPYSANDLQMSYPEEAQRPNVTPVPIKTPLMSNQDGTPDNDKILKLRESVVPIEEVFIELPDTAIQKILNKSLGNTNEQNDNQ